MYHILLYKYKSCCDSQKFKIYCHNLLTQNDAFHQYKHSVHYWFPFYIHSSSFTVSVQTLQSPIYVPLSSSPCHTPTCQWMIDCNHTPINFCSYNFKVEISVCMARNFIFIWHGKNHDIRCPETNLAWHWPRETSNPPKKLGLSWRNIGERCP